MVPITSAAKPTLAICGQDLPKEMVVRIIERLDRSSMLAFLSANRWLRNSFSEEVLRLRIVRIVAPPGGPSKHAEKLSEVQCALADLRAQQQNVSPQAFEDLLLQLIPTLMFLTATERGPLIRGMLDAGEALPGGLPESIICVLGEVLLCLKVDDEDAHRKRLKSACEQLLEERREMVRLTWEVRDLRVQQQGRTYELPGFKRLLEKLETRQDKLRLPLLKKAIHLLAWELWMDKVRDQVVAIAERASTPDERGELLLTLGQVMVNTLSTQFDPVYGTGDAMRASGEAIGEQLPKLLPAAKGLSPAHTLGFQVAMCQLLLWSTISPVPSQYWLQLLEHVQNNRVDGQIAVLRGLLYCFGAGVLEVDNAALQGELADLLLLYAALETHPADVKAAPLALALLCQVPFPAQRMQELCSHFCSVIDNLGRGFRTKHCKVFLDLACGLPAGETRRPVLAALLQKRLATRPSALKELNGLVRSADAAAREPLLNDLLAVAKTLAGSHQGGAESSKMPASAKARLEQAMKLLECISVNAGSLPLAAGLRLREEVASLMAAILAQDG